MMRSDKVFMVSSAAMIIGFGLLHDYGNRQTRAALDAHIANHAAWIMDKPCRSPVIGGTDAQCIDGHIIDVSPDQARPARKRSAKEEGEAMIRTVDNRNLDEMAAYLQDRVDALSRRVTELEAENREMLECIHDQQQFVRAVRSGSMVERDKS